MLIDAIDPTRTDLPFWLRSGQVNTSPADVVEAANDYEKLSIVDLLILIAFTTGIIGCARVVNVMAATLLS